MGSDILSVLAFLFIGDSYLKYVIMFLKPSCCFPTVIYPTLKPRPQPQPGNSGNSGGYFNDGDRNDGHYPPRPRPPAGECLPRIFHMEMQAWPIGGRDACSTGLKSVTFEALVSST
ncbi:glycoprotein Xg isoform X4 [Sapajus apella]|uniref:Glycoprotein Xg isoform X4 n=1 Tax=Sapajus apella TaxID=9515 RepID=A0A6J3H1A1_SAPAP|nr:glycoprotein Xg isoform X4 [Sapajus apella]